mgnify:CR=1 FL=1
MPDTIRFQEEYPLVSEEMLHETLPSSSSSSTSLDTLQLDLPLEQQTSKVGYLRPIGLVKGLEVRSPLLLLLVGSLGCCYNLHSGATASERSADHGEIGTPDSSPSAPAAGRVSLCRQAQRQARGRAGAHGRREAQHFWWWIQA